MPASVSFLRPQRRRDPVVPTPARLRAAFDAELIRPPPRPSGIAACVAWLQQDPAHLVGEQSAVRALEGLRAGLFSAPGRDAEMGLLWREALASACYARVIATAMPFDAPLLTGAALLHRTGEVTALRALARAEGLTGERATANTMQQLLDTHDDAVVSRVTRCWSLPGELRLTILRWRNEQENLHRPQCVTLLMMVQALATELVHAATCTPGLLQAACETLQLPRRLIDSANAATSRINTMLAAVAR